MRRGDDGGGGGGAGTTGGLGGDGGGGFGGIRGLPGSNDGGDGSDGTGRGGGGGGGGGAAHGYVGSTPPAGNITGGKGGKGGKGDSGFGGGGGGAGGYGVVGSAPSGDASGGDGGNGGDGSGGGDGGNGGDGGYGLVGNALPNGAVSGGNGGDAGNSGGGASGGGGGGHGGYAAVLSDVQGAINGIINGGTGGDGGSGGIGEPGSAGSGGGGGTGGVGLQLNGKSQVAVSSSSTITGGTGGNGGINGDGSGRGGDGGAGLYSPDRSAITNDGTVNGGHGGNGGYIGLGEFGGGGGNGSDGVALSGNGSSLINNSDGTVTGGTAGHGGDADDGNGSNGNGGTGGNGVRFIADGTLTNAGKINGGTGGNAGSGRRGGLGGLGGAGVLVKSGKAVITNSDSGVITGGTGGDGTGDGGGSGGNGVTLDTGSSLTNSGTIDGGAGGSGGSGGTYTGGDGGVGVSINGGTLNNTGAIYGGSAGSGSNGGASGSAGEPISGSNATVINSGLISVAPGGAANAITFGTGANRLELRQGSTINGDVVAMNGSGDTLALGGEANGAFNLSAIGAANQYQGFEHFDKAGASTWTVTETGTFGGNATVSEGTLLVNGSLGTARTTVRQGGTLGGSGSLASDVTIASGGTLAPGVANRALTVDGDLTFASGAILAVTAPGSSVATTGLVTLGNGALVHVDDASVTLGATQTILTADGGIAGMFGMARDFAFVDALLDHQANAVTLTVDRNDASFASVGASLNHAAVAPAIEGLGLGHALHDAVLMLSEDEARAAFDQLSGETIQASASVALIEDSDFIRDVVTSRIRDAFDGRSSMPVMGFGPEGAQGDASSDPYRYAAWGTAFGGFGESDGGGNAAGLDRSSLGFLAGGDALVAETWRIGLFAGYSRSSFDSDERAASGDSDNVHVGAYGGTQWGLLGLRFGAAYSWHDVETSRNVAFDGFADSLTAEYDASTAQVFGEAGYRIDRAGASFEPFAGLAYVNVDTDGFAEEGGAAALSGEGGSNGVTFSTLGLRGSTGFAIAGTSARARGAVAWRHAFGDVTPLSTHSFAGSDAFTAAGTPIAEDALVLEAGLDLDISERASFGVSYNGQVGDGAYDHAFSGALKVRF